MKVVHLSAQMSPIHFILMQQVTNTGLKVQSLGAWKKLLFNTSLHEIQGCQKRLKEAAEYAGVDGPRDRVNPRPEE